MRKRAAQTGYRLRAGAKRARATAAQAGHGPRPGSSARAGAKPLARHRQGGHGRDGADGFDGRTQQTIITDIYNIGVSSCSKLTETTDLAGVLCIFATILRALSGCTWLPGNLRAFIKTTCEKGRGRHGARPATGKDRGQAAQGPDRQRIAKRAIRRAETALSAGQNGPRPTAGGPGAHRQRGRLLPQGRPASGADGPHPPEKGDAARP